MHRVKSELRRPPASAAAVTRHARRGRERAVREYLAADRIRSEPGASRPHDGQKEDVGPR